MSVSQVPIRPIAKGSMAKLWLGLALLAALAFGIAWMGAGQFKTVTVDTVAAGTGLDRLDADAGGPAGARPGQEQAGGDEQQDPQPELGKRAALQWTERDLAD